LVYNLKFIEKVLNRVSRNILFVALLLISTVANAQKFGFGCLGLSGFYVGMSEYHYDTPGLNDFANSELLLSNFAAEDQVKFSLGSGYRVGANFFRAKWDKVFITAKGYYQFLKEENTINSPEGSSLAQQKYMLNMNHWGVAIDIGIPLTSFLDWKILEGGVSFFNAELTQQKYENNSLKDEFKFSPEKAKATYFAATGIIIHIVPDYMSLEGTGGYYFMKIEEFKNQSNLAVGSGIIKNAIPKGGWSATLQINISFPF
jgi:hypothetical protein